MFVDVFNSLVVVDDASVAPLAPPSSSDILVAIFFVGKKSSHGNHLQWRMAEADGIDSHLGINLTFVGGFSLATENDQTPATALGIAFAAVA